MPERPRVVKQLSDMSIDEVSLVDRGANQHASIAFSKRAPEESMTVEQIFEELAKASKRSSGGKGAAPGKEEYTASGDPSGIRDEADEDNPRDVGPGSKKDLGRKHGRKVKGEDLPYTGSFKSSGEDVNPSKLSGLGKSLGIDVGDDFWNEVVNNPEFAAEVQKSLMGDEYAEDDDEDGDYEDEYDEYDDEDEDDVEKAFPQQQQQNPMQSPFPGAMGPGMQPSMQTMGAQPMGMGQPTMPGGAMGAMGAPGAMGGGAMMGGGQQLPPDVVAYIQQLEQALQQAQGGSSGDSSGNSDSSSSDDSSSSSSDSGNPDKKKNPFGKSGDFEEMNETYFLEELAKSLDDEDQREYVAKALETVSKAEQRAVEAERIAKAERDLRLEREFIAKAREYNVPVRPEELGPVLKRCAETLSREDLGVVVKCLQSASSAQDGLFNEIGKRGGGDNASILDEVSAKADEMLIQKNGISNEEAFVSVLESNPRAYDEYMANHPSRRIR